MFDIFKIYVFPYAYIYLKEGKHKNNYCTLVSEMFTKMFRVGIY